MSNQFFLAMLLSALVAYSAQAQEKEKKQEKKADSAEKKSDEPSKLIQIRKAMSKERSEIIAELRKSKSGSPEYSALLSNYYGVVDKYADEIIAAVKEDPSNRVGGAMLVEVVRMTRKDEIRTQCHTTMLEIAKADPKGPSGYQMLSMVVIGDASPMLKGEATTLFIKNFGDSPKIADFAMSMTREKPSAQNIQLLRKLLEKASEDNVKGPLTFTLGKMLASNENSKAKGLELLKTISKEYADVMVYSGRRSLAKMADGEIFEMENLQIGMDVPDIEGEDVDGVQFKLSDYKGKVVVIDFWGDW